MQEQHWVGWQPGQERLRKVHGYPQKHRQLRLWTRSQHKKVKKSDNSKSIKLRIIEDKLLYQLLDADIFLLRGQTKAELPIQAPEGSDEGSPKPEEESYAFRRHLRKGLRASRLQVLLPCGVRPREGRIGEGESH